MYYYSSVPVAYLESVAQKSGSFIDFRTGSSHFAATVPRRCGCKRARIVASGSLYKCVENLKLLA